MKPKTNPSEPNVQLTNVPLMYADSLVGLAIGPFVSKIILGVEDPAQQHTPSLQISMPTNALHNLAKHIIELLHDPEAQKNLARGHKDFQDSMAE